MLGGESVFVTTLRAPASGGWVDVAPSLPSDAIAVENDPVNPLSITRGAWLYSSTSLEIDTKWAGFRSIVGGEGAFLARATGEGSLVLSCYGALNVHSLAPGERIVVDTGHFVAYEGSVQTKVQKAGSGVISSLTSGGGLVFEFTGPGDVLTQSRNPGLLGKTASSVGSRQ